MKKERSKYLSIYEQVAHDLRGAIESGTYKAGARKEKGRERKNG